MLSDSRVVLTGAIVFEMRCNNDVSLFQVGGRL